MCSQHLQLKRVDLDRSLAKKKNTSLPHQILKNLWTRNNFVFLCGLILFLSYNTGVDSVKLRDDEYTLQHVKAFGITNHLMLDQWNPNNVLYVDNTGSVMKMRVVLVSLDPNTTPFPSPSPFHPHSPVDEDFDQDTVKPWTHFQPRMSSVSCYAQEIANSIKICLKQVHVWMVLGQSTVR